MDETQGIAIVGMVGRFPGAPDLETFWHNVAQGVCSLKTVPTTAENEVPVRGTLDGAEDFDASFFGFQPREAEVTDPQQRVFLEACWSALEAAGYVPETFPGSIGVWAGMSNNTYWHLVRQRPDLEASAGAMTVMLGNEKDYVALRVAYKLGLRGPALAQNTACSTSLVAVVNAVNALLSFQCDLALAGGVAISFPQERGYTAVPGSILSPDGSVYAFDARANGTVFGSGVGVVVLKRLEEAQRDGDTIHAVIRGGAINNDGADKAGFTAPSISGQAEVIALAQALAGVQADEVSYIESHGTGTSLGDPIEVAGLTRAFRETTDRTRFCALGTLKPNIGHLDVASGIAGLLKTVLALKHRQLPPAIHFETPNPQIAWAESPFVVNTTLKPWDAPTRIAGVSSFGFGGTNAHVVVSEAPAPVRPAAPAEPALLVVSARSEAAVATAAQNLADHLVRHPELDLADVAATLQVGRRAFSHRRAVRVRDTAEAITALPDRKRGAWGKALASPSAVFLFPGQGAQSVGMGRALYESSTVFRDAVDRCAELLCEPLGTDLRTVLFHDEARLNQTAFTQPALFTISYATAVWYAAQGITPAAMVGHSLGEFVAAHLAGVFTLEEALAVVAERARRMQSLPPGGMAALRLPEAEARAQAERFGLSLAAVNAPQLCVVSGTFDALAALETSGVETRRLTTSHAFHSTMTEPILEDFTAFVATVERSAPTRPFVSSRTGTWITAAEAVSPDYWAQQLRHTVRFHDALTTLLAEPGRVLVECGPGRVLTGLARQHAAKPVTVVTFDDTGSADDALSRCWVAGLTLPEPAHVHRVSLPTYPFERQRYYAEPAEPVPARQHESTPMPIPDRLPRLVAQIQATLSDLSGLAVTDIVADAAFSELGFDSLFLTQAAQALGKELGVSLAFRQLMEDLSTPAALAAYADAKLPAETVPAAVVPAVPAAPETFSLRPSAGSMPGTAVEALVAQQLAIMQQQLALLGSGASLPLPLPSLETPLREDEGRGVRGGKEREGVGEQRDAGSAENHGPFRPIQKASGEEFTPEQKGHLTALTADYLARTRRSREFTQQHRGHLSDPRAVSGFKPFWKELVYPIVAERSKGARIWDIDGNEYIDLTMGFGLNFLGHGPDFVLEAVRQQLDKGIEIGPQSVLAGQVAEKLCRYVGAERAIFCNTGSEAVMAAVRAARTVTGRDKIVTFAGAYHGVHDEVLVRGNGRGKSFPIAPGIPQSAVSEVIVLDYGSPAALETIRERADEIAAILVEPVQSRHPDLRPIAFVQELRALAAEKDIAFIFDEIVNGFRLGPRGAAGFYGIEPDLQTFGKVLGGGIVVGAVAGKARFLDAFDGGAWSYDDDSFPSVGMTFFAGTFVRHPLAMAAADAVLDFFVANPTVADDLAERGERFGARLDAILKKWQVPFPLERFRSMFYLNTHGATVGGMLHFHLRLRGIHIWEYRPFFLSITHTDADLERILEAFESSCAALAAGGFLPAATEARLSESALTPQQREVWLAAQGSESASVAYNESIAVHLEGDLDESKLRRDLQTLVDRHEGLRATFTDDGARMTVAEHLVLDLPRIETDEAGLAALQKAEAGRPFDLAHGPLVRVHLVRLSARHHVVVFTAHHLVCDGWSFGILLTELAALYRGETLPAAQPFSAVASLLEGADDVPYWRAQLDPLPEPLALPLDFPRPAVFDYAGDRLHHVLPEELVRGLRKLSGKHGATLFATLLTGFEALLHRLTGQSALVIGVPAAGQTTLASDAPLVGHAVNLLPLPLRLPESTPSFAALLGLRKKQILDAFEHRACTFGSLVSALALPRDASRNPLVGVTFNLERTGSGDLGFPGLTSRMTKSPRLACPFEQEWNLVDDGASVEIEVTYSTALFAPETIVRWMGHFETLLRGVLAAPETLLDQLPLLTAADEASLSRFGGVLGAPPKGSLWEHFAAQVGAHPEAVALTAGTTRLTYAALATEASRLADQLTALGVQPGDPVAIQLPRSVETVIAVLGILKTGAFYVPLDTAYPPDRIAWMLEDSGARAVVALPAPSGHLPAAETATLFPLSLVPRGEEGLIGNTLSNPLPSEPASDQGKRVAGVPAKRGGGEMARRAAGEMAALLYTSGSTGTPKGVCVTAQAILRLVVGADWLNFAGETFLFHSAFAFDATLLEIFGPLLNGGRLVVAPEGPLTLAELGETIREQGVSTLWLTAGLFHALIDHRPQDLKGVRQLLAGGDVLSVPHVARALTSLPETRLFNGYGPTENTTFTAVHPLVAADTRRSRIPIGKPVTGTTVRVLDAGDALCPIGVVGELCAGGYGLAAGYHRDPERTAARFVDVRGERLYRTGDLAFWRPDGTLEFLGRADSQLKIRGNRVEPGELESVLAQLPGVREAVVTASADPHGQRFLAAYVVGDADPSALRHALAARLPSYLLPSVIVPLERLPLNASGKVDRALLPAPLFSAPQTAATGNETGPAGLVERLMGEALGREDIGANDDFFALGGDSLKAIRLFARLEDETGIRLPLSALFQAPTPALLSARLTPEAAVESPVPSRGSLVPIRRTGTQPPLFLIHHVQGIAILYHDLARHLGDDQPVYGIEAAGLDGISEPHTDLGELARDYTALIRRAAPRGPYRVAGFSSGGILAVEVARRLEAEGQLVDFVGLLDSYAPAYHQAHPENLNPETAGQRLAAHWSMFRKLDRKDQGQYLKHRLRKVQDRLQANTAAPEEPDQALVSVLTRVRAAQEQLIAHHTPLPYAGPVTLFRAEEHPADPWDERLFWGETFPELTLCDVPGDHHLLIQEPFVRTLAALLAEKLPRETVLRLAA